MSQAIEKLGNQGNLQQLLARNKGALAQVLPKHVSVDRLVKLALVAANQNPALYGCSQESVALALMQVAELGLDLSPVRQEAYLVPYGNKVTLVPGYRGLAKLARQTGQVQRIECEVVYEKDRFEYVKGSDFRLVFEPLLTGEDRGLVRGVYAYCVLEGGVPQAEFMTRAQVEEIRQGAVSKNSPAWKNHWSEMARKTVFRRLSKWLPLSSEIFDKALELDNLDYPKQPSQIEVSLGPEDSKASDLGKRIGSSEDPPLETAEVSEVSPTPAAEASTTGDQVEIVSG